MFNAFFSSWIYSKEGSPAPSTASRRSSVSTAEPQDVSAAHVTSVKDTSRYWYKPNIAREEGKILNLKDPSASTKNLEASSCFDVVTILWILWGL